MGAPSNPTSSLDGLGALGLVSGQDPSQAMYDNSILADPRMERVLNSAVEMSSPNKSEDDLNSALGFASGIAGNPAGGLAAGFAGEAAQRNKQKELQAQYLPAITQALLARQSIRADMAQFSEMTRLMNRRRGGGGGGAALGPSGLPTGGGGGPTGGGVGPSGEPSGGEPALFEPGSPSNPIGLDQGLAAAYWKTDRPKYLELQAQMYAPNDPTKAIVAAGGGQNEIQDINRKFADKLTTQPIESPRGAVWIERKDGKYIMHATPSQTPPGYEKVPVGFAPDGTPVFENRPSLGGLESVAGSAGAHAAGVATAEAEQVWTPGPNGTWIRGPVPRATALGLNVPGGGAGGANYNNPGNMRPPGSDTGFQNFATPQAGLEAMDKNLQSYGARGINTIAGIVSTWAPPRNKQGGVENDTAAYMADVSKRLGIPPNQPLDLSNPLVRHALSTAIMLHEHGSGILTQGGGAPPAAQSGYGRPLSEPPLGVTQNVEKGNEVTPQTMKDSWSQIRNVVANSQAIKQNLAEMIELSKHKSDLLTTGPLGGPSIAGAIDTNAMEYNKKMANVNTLLGLGGAGGNSGTTDFAKHLLGEGIPDWSKHKEAIKNGLTTINDQLTNQQVKSTYVLPAATAGNSNEYTKRENEYDRHMDPYTAARLAPVLEMPYGAPRTQAIKQAAMYPGTNKEDPKMKAAIEWAYRSGLFKGKE